MECVAASKTPLYHVALKRICHRATEYTRITCYVKNEGNTPTTLSLLVDNWSSTAAQNYISVSWNYNGASIEPSATVAVTMTLSVASNIQGVETFSFDITIIGS